MPAGGWGGAGEGGRDTLPDPYMERCLWVGVGGLGRGGGGVGRGARPHLLIKLSPSPPPRHVLQGVYRTFISNSKFVSAASAPHIAFMSSCCVELWGMDVGAAYQHAFGAIRQLASALRNALNQKTADSYKEVRRGRDHGGRGGGSRALTRR